jgi:hypothetical protein
MNDDIQTIVEIVILLFFVGLMFIPFLLFFVYVFYQNSKRKKIRERTRQAFGQLIGNNNTLPVRYCSERHFKSWLKILPWEGTGLIVPGNGVITFVGEKLNGVALNLQFGRGDSTVMWLGKCPFPNGAVSFFCFDMRGEKHYFTSETGVFVFGSHKSTKAAFDESQRSFATSGAQVA